MGSLYRKLTGLFTSESVPVVMGAFASMPVWVPWMVTVALFNVLLWVLMRNSIIEPFIGTHARSRLFVSTMIVLAICCVVLPIHALHAPETERLAWMSGQFGEAPWNRSVHVNRSTEEPGTTTLWVEFRAEQFPVLGVNSIVEIAPPDVYEKSVSWYSCPPGLRVRPAGSDARQCGGIGTTVSTYAANGIIGARTMDSSTTPERSTYVSLKKKNTGPWSFACYFRAAHEIDQHVCGADVLVTALHDGVPVP